VSLSSDGSIVAIGAYENDGNGENSGHVRVYEWYGNDNKSWVQRGEDIDGEAANDKSGTSVSLSSDGSILAIGANYNDGNGENSGHVRVYEWNGASWIQRGIDIDGEATSDQSGYSVSLSSDGTIVAIGSIANSENSGHVRVYKYEKQFHARRFEYYINDILLHQHESDIDDIEASCFIKGLEYNTYETIGNITVTPKTDKKVVQLENKVNIIGYMFNVHPEAYSKGPKNIQLEYTNTSVNIVENIEYTLYQVDSNYNMYNPPIIVTNDIPISNGVNRIYYLLIFNKAVSTNEIKIFCTNHGNTYWSNWDSKLIFESGESSILNNVKWLYKKDVINTADMNDKGDKISLTTRSGGYVYELSNNDWGIVNSPIYLEDNFDSQYQNKFITLDSTGKRVALYEKKDFNIFDRILYNLSTPLSSNKWMIDNNSKKLTITNKIYYCTVLFQLNQNSKTVINYTKYSSGSSHNIYMGIQTKPTRFGSYHGGTTGNGNGGILQHIVESNGSHIFIIDLINKKIIHDGVMHNINTDILDDNSEIYLGVYDGTYVSGTQHITFNYVYEYTTDETNQHMKIYSDISGEWIRDQYALTDNNIFVNSIVPNKNITKIAQENKSDGYRNINVIELNDNYFNDGYSKRDISININETMSNSAYKNTGILKVDSSNTFIVDVTTNKSIDIDNIDKVIGVRSTVIETNNGNVESEVLEYCDKGMYETRGIIRANNNNALYVSKNKYNLFNSDYIGAEVVYFSNGDKNVQGTFELFELENNIRSGFEINDNKNINIINNDSIISLESVVIRDGDR